MKRLLFPLLFVGGVAYLPAHRAAAQDKPVLNTTPPGPPPATPRTAQPVRTAPVPEPVPTPEPNAAPAPQPTPNSPSGLNFPNRDGRHGSSEDEAAHSKKFIYANIGLGLSSDAYTSRFNVSGAPALGFRITDKFAAGPGISYAYSSFSLQNNVKGALNANGDRSISSSSLGIKAFAQYIVYKEFFVHAEYEVTSAELVDVDQTRGYFKYKRTVTTPLAGIGYRSYLGQRAAADIVALYNFDNSIFSLYPGLVVRFSFLFDIGK